MSEYYEAPRFYIEARKGPDMVTREVIEGDYFGGTVTDAVYVRGLQDALREWLKRCDEHTRESIAEMGWDEEDE